MEKPVGIKLGHYRLLKMQRREVVIKVLIALTAVSAIVITNCIQTRENAALQASFNTETMDSFFSMLEENDRAMGSISIFENGREVYSRQIGFRDISAGHYHDRDTEFRVGSISKTFLAAVIMQMVEEGRLSLETRLDNFFPEVANSQNITIRQMLQHRSGIFNLTDDETFPEWMQANQNRASLLQRITEYESLFEPGTQENYSNSNYFLLALIAEKTDSASYDMVIYNRIANPLGLKRTHVGDTVEPLRNEALPYLFVGHWLEITAIHPSVLFGAGDIVSTPYELNVFFYNLFNGTLVSENSLNEMKNIEGTFGLGLFEIPFYGRQALGHTGGMPGFNAITLYFPDEGVLVSYATNALRFPINDILIGVLSIAFAETFEMPVFEDALLLPAEVLQRYAGVYASPDFPFLITVFIEDGILMAQATGQSAFPLDAVDEYNFVFETAHIHIQFLPEAGEMIMTQAGHSFRFTMTED